MSVCESDRGTEDHVMAKEEELGKGSMLDMSIESLFYTEKIPERCFLTGRKGSNRKCYSQLCMTVKMVGEFKMLKCIFQKDTLHSSHKKMH